jgi:predicted nucleotidyltransferase
MSEKILELQKKIYPVLEANDVVKASVFGSFARGENLPESDVDILVELKEPKGLLFLAGLKFELEDAIGRKVDLLTYKSVNPLLKSYIYKDEIKIYG